MEVLWDGDRVPPRKDIEPVEVLWDGDGVPPRKDMEPVEVLWDGDGGTPPSPRCGQTHTCENITFPHSVGSAGGKN